MQNFWLFVLVALIASGAPVLGQDSAPQSPLKSRAPYSLVSPLKSAAPKSNRIELAGARREEGDVDSRKKIWIDDDSADLEDDVPPPDYPADPPWPSWTAANDPSKQPIFAPAGQYDLVRPPHGIFQSLKDQEYERIVGSEEDLVYECATCPPAIDLMRPDGMAPAGVFGDHTLNTGGRVLLSYRFNATSYDGLLSGTHSVSNASVFNNFTLAPTHETALTHYFVGEFGPTEDFTFQFILPIIERRIQFVGQGGQRPVTDVTDLYDLQFNTMYVLHRWDRQQIHLNIGMRTPNGIYDQQGQVPTPTSPNLTYPMRTSDGTWDFLPGITYRGQSDDWTWGAQALFTKRFGKSRYDYRLGDEANLNLWISRKLTDSLSASARLNGDLWGNIVGADHRLNPALVPSNRPDLQGGRLLNILFGLNYIVPSGALQGQRLGVEGGLPAYQSLFGPQLQQRYEIWSNVSITF